MQRMACIRLADFNPLQRKAGDLGNKTGIVIHNEISIHSSAKPETNRYVSVDYGTQFQSTPAQSRRLHIPDPGHYLIRFQSTSFISANPSIYLCSLTFRTTLYCFIITPSLQLFQKHFLLFPPQRILFTKIFLIFPVREFSF